MRYESHLVRPLAGLALLVVGGYALRTLVRAVVVSEIERTGALPWWLPEFGTAGETVVTYLLFVSLISYVVVPLLAFALGYRSGKGATE